jgi:ABC-2 type transport system permease protein
MRKLLAIAWNDIRMQFMERSEIVFFLILPIVFTTILATSMTGNSGGDSRYPVLVVDEDKSALSQQFVAGLQASTVIDAQIKTQADADSAFTQKDAYIPAIVTIPSGFAAGVLDGQPASVNVRRAPSDNRVLAVEQEVTTVAGQLSNAVQTGRVSVAEAELIRPFANAAARQAYVEQSMALALTQLKNPAARVEVTRAGVPMRQSMSPAEQESAGQMVTWVLITLIGAAAVFVEERIGGTLRRLASTPTAKATILGGKILGRLSTGLVQMLLLIVFGAVVFNVQWGRSPLALAAIMLSFALAAVAFGVLLGTFAKTRSQAGGMVILFSMLTAALGGCWWPLEITPAAYQTVVKILPTTWAMQGFQNVLVRGAGLNTVLPQVGVLLLFAVVFFAVGVKRLRFD